ncbi:hypothetical protein [Cryobacterium sp. BB736]|uniref:hypothetical protein n=1 Tax=Cryobacterium sp. BB736 TaxID=2746963 RepID=UPI0018745236|nr:hypothetical protein [Cryobacterium sp. BB736]
MLSVKSRVEDGSQRVKSVPPMPLNAAAFNDANELYSRLVYWCGVWAGKLSRQAPGPARRAWLAGGRVVGLPADVSPEDARYAVGVMSKWLLVNLDDVLGLWWFDDIEFFIDELAGDVETVSAKFPTEDKPTFSDKAPCPDDGGRLVMYPPRFFGDHQDIICETCGRVFSETQHEFFARVFRQTRDERVAGLRVSGHLTRKYAG